MSEANQKLLVEAFVGVFFRDFRTEDLKEVLEAWKLSPVTPETTLYSAALQREIELRQAKEGGAHD